MNPRTHRRPLALLLCAVALALTACGSKTSKPADIPAGGAVTTSATTTATTGAQQSGKPGKVAKGANETNLKKKPTIPKPTGDPPSQLQKRDIVKGKGAVAKSGQTVTVNYVGIAWSTGQEFDTSFGKKPFKFKLGAGMVIPGWDEGVVGMKVGGRRQLIIPADKAYGPQGSPPAIGPNETLVFDIDLLKAGK